MRRAAADTSLRKQVRIGERGDRVEVDGREVGVGVHPLGIDFGGSGIKGAPVDLTTGKFAAERLRIDTPKPSTPEAVAKVVAEIAEHFHEETGDSPIGVTVPGIVRNGKVLSAANIGAISTAGLAGLSGAGISVLSPDQIAGLKTNQIAALKIAQVAAFTADQIPVLTTTQLSSLSGGQVASFTSNQVAIMTPAQQTALFH